MGGILGGGGSQTSVTQQSGQQTTTNVSTSVSVNPTIVNSIDTSPLVGPFNNLVAALQGSGGSLSASVEDLAQAIGAGQAAQANAVSQAGSSIYYELQNWAAIAAIAAAAFTVFWHRRS